MSTGPIKVSLSDIRSSKASFSRLAALHVALDACLFDTIEADFSRCTWFDANMSAPLGVVLARAQNVNTLELKGLAPGVKTILSKNSFLTDFGFPKRPDTYGTTIPYQRFAIADNCKFAEYLNSHLRGKKLPRMTPALSASFKRNILEIFVNATIHSESELGIFVCGQYFPKRNRLGFCVADAGIGIRRKIYKELGIKMNSDQAIDWALQEGHTTRKGSVPGGLGLKLIREFISMNQGRIQIVSDRGCWEFSAGQETLTRIDLGFPGTVINIEINTADTSSYCLRGELKS